MPVNGPWETGREVKHLSSCKSMEVHIRARNKAKSQKYWPQTLANRRPRSVPTLPTAESITITREPVPGMGHGPGGVDPTPSRLAFMDPYRTFSERPVQGTARAQYIIPDMKLDATMDKRTLMDGAGPTPVECPRAVRGCHLGVKGPGVNWGRTEYGAPWAKHDGIVTRPLAWSRYTGDGPGTRDIPPLGTVQNFPPARPPCLPHPDHLFEWNREQGSGSKLTY